MKLFTKPIWDRLIANGLKQLEYEQREDHTVHDPYPVVKLFTPDSACTWLLTELDPEYQDIAFGLCDLGVGFPELGSVSISELLDVRGKLGLPIERDKFFKATKPLSEYAHEAHEKGYINA